MKQTKIYNNILRHKKMKITNNILESNEQASMMMIDDGDIDRC